MDAKHTNTTAHPPDYINPTSLSIARFFLCLGFFKARDIAHTDTYILKLVQKFPFQTRIRKNNT